ncbi:hypothetical protein Hanom_Chr11g01061521 [Helianthus anomalus]
MHWRVMPAKEKVKDVAPPKAEYQENAIFNALTTHPSKITIVPDGALALVGMSLCWRDVQIYPAFRTADGCNSLSILIADLLLRPWEDDILRAHASNILILPPNMDRKLQGLPIGGVVEGVDSAAPPPRK